MFVQKAIASTWIVREDGQPVSSYAELGIQLRRLCDNGEKEKVSVQQLILLFSYKANHRLYHVIPTGLEIQVFCIHP